MNPGLRAAASGMIAQNRRVEAISHNIANVNTTAYKASRVQFEDLLYQTVQGPRLQSMPGVETTPGVQIGRGVRVVANSKMFTQGSLEMTNRELDLAIDGDGFLQVMMPDGTMAYTRDGSLSVSADNGLLTVRGGELVFPDVTIPSDAANVTISSTGIVSAVAANGQALEVGRLELVRFGNPEGLSAIGQNLYVETPASGQAVAGYPQENGFGRIIQGALEGSNVEIVSEMVDMIQAMRAYELSSRAIQSADQMAEQASAIGR
jgi:flagellar basal-body rod protein FlgG